MNSRYTNVILLVIALNLTFLTLDRVLDRFISDAYASPSNVQKIAICDSLGIKCADISSLVRGSLLVKEGK